MDKYTLDKANKLMQNIKFIQDKMDTLYTESMVLVQEKADAVPEEIVINVVRKLMESYEGSMALTDIVSVVIDGYRRNIEKYQKEFDEL